ncbi:MAG: 50S ribosomal protein L28, partial [Candidatus Lambdaproteobacteria bacterium]|nr:50S ribosomal protein L28 [Candidatus Lambdaproteobacteria bacterium]
MSRKCQISGKTGLNGHLVSHANNKSNHVQQPNLQKRRIFVPELKRWVTVRLSTKGLKTLDRKGAYRTLKA